MRPKPLCVSVAAGMRNGRSREPSGAAGATAPRYEKKPQSRSEKPHDCPRSARTHAPFASAGSSRLRHRLMRALVISRRASAASASGACGPCRGSGGAGDESALASRRQRGPVRLFRQNVGQRFSDILAAECAPSRDHLVEHTSQRPNVRSLVRGPSFCLLGRHVSSRAENHAHTGHHRRARNRR